MQLDEFNKVWDGFNCKINCGKESSCESCGQVAEYFWKAALKCFRERSKSRNIIEDINEELGEN